MNALSSISRGAVSSWRSQNRAQRLLRFFLSVTWIYAGWDKASDPGFLTKGEPTFIGTQLAAYAQSSPISFLLNHTIEHATQVGIFVMVAEFAIGIATLLSVAPTTAAFGGFAMATGLWLSSSFNVTPYFLASDSAYAILWLTYLLLLIGNRRMPGTNFQRRNVFRTGIVAVLAAGAALVGRAVSPSNAASSTNRAAKSRGKKIVKLSALPVGATFNFIHSSQGVPSLLFRTKKGVFAYSAICTHQGCTVAYKSSTKKLVCPCHGAEFDPMNSAKVISGPAETPLAKVAVKVSGAWVVEA
jgi:thiosulfate dehydrogenase [quinone] large subunit